MDNTGPFVHMPRMIRNLFPFLDDAALIGVAAAGGLALHAVGVPAGWLTGAMLLVALVAVVRPWAGPSPLTLNIGMLLSGAVIGSTATPEAVAAVGRYPASLLILLVSMLLTMVVTGAYLVRIGKWTRLDAMLASAPGALSTVMAIAAERSDGMPRIAVIQSFRLFVLVAGLPSLLVLAGIGAVESGLPVHPPSWRDAAITLVAGLVVGMVFARLGVVAPYVLGATMASMVLHAADLVHGSLPLPLSVLAFVLIGAMVGSRLGRLDRATMLRLMPLAVGAFFASVAVAALCAVPAAWAAGVSYGAAFVAFAPGGIEAMAMMAVVLGFDPLYVGAHHLVRFAAVGFCLPLVVRLLAPPQG
jgi:uncharacterized protein